MVVKLGHQCPNHSVYNYYLIEKAEDLYEDDYENSAFGALAYEISTILEVIDKNRVSDIKALETLYFILSNEVEGHRLWRDLNIRYPLFLKKQI